MAHETDLVDLVSTVKTLSTQPESYFQPSKRIPKETLKSVKLLFDFSRQNDGFKENNSCCLPELMVEGFDDEQIWQQIELQNNPVVADIKRQLKQLKAARDRVQLLPESVEKNSFHDAYEDNEVEFDDSDSDLDDDDENTKGRALMPASSSDDDGDDDGNDDNSENDDDDQHDDSDDCENNNVTKGQMQKTKDITKKQQSNKQKGKQKYKNKGSIVDDQFFKLSEMTEFLDKMDQQFERSRDDKKTKEDNDDDDDDDDDDEVDFFRDISSEDGDDDEDDGDDWGNVLGNTAKMMGRDIKASKHKTAAELKYSDYFDPPDDEQQKTSNKDMGDDSDMDADDDGSDFGSDNDEGMDNGDDDGDDDDGDNVKEEYDEDAMDNNSKNEVVSKDDEENKSLSQHEKEQEKMKKKISQLEKENLSKKPWQMSGEAGSTTRPINSLLEEDLNFDHTTAAAPPITEETTKNLEDIIKQRIKDEAWDDVERKQKPVSEPFEYKKKLPLDQEKSKLSLSQIYEQEYIKQTEVKEGHEEEESEEHKEIKQLMSKLFAKLDALSNFHFTPKPLKPEIKIVTNTPVISMEEVAPVAVSDAMMLAPEETHEKKIELKGDTEKTDTDKKRDRRTKKLRQRMKAKDKEKKAKLLDKLKPGLGNKYAKKKALERIEKENKTSKNVSVIKEDSGEKALKSSSAFFSRLHDEVKQQVKSKKDSTIKKKKKTNTSQLKL